MPTEPMSDPRLRAEVAEHAYPLLFVHTTPEHDELKHIARGCVTRACVRHYLGFAANQWQLFEKESPPRIKPLLYVFRVLLSGIHMMRTGEVNANLPDCNAAFGDARLTWVDELIARKAAGGEQRTLSDGDLAFYRREYDRLRERLTVEAERSVLPPAATAKAAMADLLRRIRVGEGGSPRIESSRRSAS